MARRILLGVAAAYVLAVAVTIWTYRSVLLDDIDLDGDDS